MTNERKTQLSLILLAGVITAGLLGWFFQSIHKDFALYQDNPQQVAQALQAAPAEAAVSAAPAEAGAVLGATDKVPASSANPQGVIYVNPFAGTGVSSRATPTVQSSQADAIILSSLAAAKPTAPIQMYVRGYVYPMAELNGCNSQQACFEYCEQLVNVPLCAMFSEKQGLMKAGSRVLGASDSAAGSVWAANPYANLSQNYSDPALNKYLASIAGSGCAPLDMVCLSQAGIQATPRVLAAIIDEKSGESSAQGYAECLDNASGGIADRDPVTILPEEVANAKEQINSCQQNFGQTVGEDAASKKQASVSDILEFQDCVSKSKNLAVDLKECIEEGFR